MRLIDADALVEHLREYKTIYGVPMTDSDKQVIHCIIGHIKNIESTAYDVEAVVAELEKHMDDARMWDEDDFYDGKARAYEYAISIVRGKE
jgi:hypothetical protein